MKVLIISHNPVSTQNNMGKTFLTLFSKVEQQELCQLYIYPTVPNLDRCASYYRVTDKQVLSALFRWNVPGGELDKSLISETEGLYQNAGDENLYRNKKNKSALRRMLRDGLWKIVRWYSPDLEAWLERESPECIFLAPGAAGFIYDIALQISSKQNIPIVTYICDEYYFVKPGRSLLEKVRLSLFQRKVRALMDNTAHLTVICDELKKEYSETFGVPTSVLMTGAGIPIVDGPRIVAEPKHICYFGNVRCNRFVSLCRIGRELDTINAETGNDFKLKIFTFEKDQSILDKFRDINSIQLCGAVTGEAYDRAFREAHLLLHTEAFDAESIDRVRHSVSTKIADSLASGIPLLAYGPKGVASMDHLHRHDSAIAAFSEGELRQMLERAFFDVAVREQTVRNALVTAKTYHDSGAAGLRLRQILAEVSEN